MLFGILALSGGSVIVLVSDVVSRDLVAHRNDKCLVLCYCFSRLSNCVLPLVPQSNLTKLQARYGHVETAHMMMARWLQVWNDHVDPPTPHERREVTVRMHINIPEVLVCKVAR